MEIDGANGTCNLILWKLNTSVGHRTQNKNSVS